MPTIAAPRTTRTRNKGPLIAERPPGFVGLVAQLPIARSADRSNPSLRLIAAKHHVKTQAGDCCGDGAVAEGLPRRVKRRRDISDTAVPQAFLS